LPTGSPMYNLKTLKYLLAAAFAVETFCVTYGLKAIPVIPVFSFIYFLSGLAIAVLLLFFPEAKLRVWPIQRKSGRPLIYKLLYISGTGFIICYLSKYWFDNVPIDIYNADMLPIIKIMGQRFMSGQWKQVYDIIPEIWKGSKPIYLPATWMPFSIPPLLGIDMRWVTALCVFFIFSIPFLMFQRRMKSTLSYFITAVMLGLFWWMMTENDAHGFISISEEGIVGAYYVLVVLALLSGNIYMTAIAISLCMLSRYALIGFVPAFFVYLILTKKWKQAAILPVIGSLFLLGMFILPFGWDTFVQLAALPGDYVGFAKRVWQDSPDVFSGSIGFAKFFGKDHILLLHHTLIMLTFLVPFLFMLGCFFAGRKRRLSNIPLATLKLGVVVFYNFIDVPYMYLFFTSSFISLIIVSFFIREDISASGLPIVAEG
jgi:hypothetical protein